MRIASYSETLMRLEVKDNLLINQANEFIYSFVGTGINFLTVQRYFGNKSYIIGALPENHLGDAAKEAIHKQNIKTDYLKRSGDVLTSYILESGFYIRPSNVLYQNRLNSGHNNYRFTDEEIENLSLEMDCLHVCGIALAINQITRENVLRLCKRMYEREKRIFFDFNYRPSLWNEKEYQISRKYYEEILLYCDTVSMSIMDANKILGIVGDDQDVIFRKLIDEYDIKCIVGTKRVVKNNNENEIFAFIKSKKLYYESQVYAFNINDRIGSGDAFFSYVVGMRLNNEDEKKTIDEAIQYSIYSQTLHGDIMPLSKTRFKAMIEGKGLMR